MNSITVWCPKSLTSSSKERIQSKVLWQLKKCILLIWGIKSREMITCSTIYTCTMLSIPTAPQQWTRASKFRCPCRCTRKSSYKTWHMKSKAMRQRKYRSNRYLRTHPSLPRPFMMQIKTRGSWCVIICLVSLASTYSSTLTTEFMMSMIISTFILTCKPPINKDCSKKMSGTLLR
jgi:hypothetical protein